MNTMSDVRANLDWITPEVATGGDLHPDESTAIAQIQHLVEMGVTHIIDCRIERNDAEIVAMIAPEIKYLHNPIDDRHGLVVPNAWFERIIAFADDAKASGGKVFAHCHMGVNRGPSAAMTVLMHWYGYKAIKAYDMVRNAREIAFLGYAEDVARYFLRSRKVAGHVYLKTMRAFTQHLNTVRTPAEKRRINDAISALHDRDWEIQGGIMRAKRSN